MQERGGEVRRLDRPPGERHTTPPVVPGRAGGSTGPARRSRVAAAFGAAGISGLITFLLAGLDIGAGLLAVGAAAGWLTGLALAGGPAGHGAEAGRGRAVWAGVLAGAGMGAGLLADGARALTQGGVLAPWAYAWERFGMLAVLVVAVAVAAGAMRGR